MTTTAYPGPLSIEGAKPAIVGPTPYIGGAPAIVNENPDFAPSLIWGGIGIRDPRYLQRIGAGALVRGGQPNQDCGWYLSAGGLVVCDEVPTTASATAIAAAQAVTSGAGMTLVAATGGGVTYLATDLSLPMPLGATIPAGSLAMERVSAYVGGGTTGAFQFFDPTTGITRAVSLTCGGGATGGVISIHGYDWYGAPMRERITAVTGTTVNGKKAFKYVTAAIPQFTDADASYSLGTADVFGLNVRADRWAYVRAVWNDTLETASTGFVAADTTNPATFATGDVRGTYAQTSDSTKRLQLFVMPSVSNMVASTVALATSGLIGVAQYNG